MIIGRLVLKWLGIVSYMDCNKVDYGAYSIKKRESPMSDTIKIDDKTYNVADLSDDAKTQINNLQMVDQQIRRLQQEAAVAQTARMAYVASLQTLLPEAVVESS